MGKELLWNGFENKSRAKEVLDIFQRQSWDFGKRVGFIFPSVILTNGNIKDRENWEDCFEWFLEMTESFHKVFSPRVKQLWTICI